MFLFVAGGRNIRRTFHRRIHRIAVRHGACKAARIAGSSYRYTRANRASSSSALRLSNTHQLNADLRQGALHHVIAHKARKAARIQTALHRIRISTLYRALLSDGAHHDARKAACIIVVR